MKRLLYILPVLFYLFTTEVLLASEKDSLQYIIDTTKIDTIKVNTLNELSEIYIDLNKDSSEFFVKKALTIAKKINYKKGVISSYKAYGILYFFKNDFKTSRKYFKEALIKAKAIKLYIQVSSLYYLIGATYYYQDNYDKAIEHYKESLKIAKKHNYTSQETNCYNAIGIVFKEKGDFEKAIDYYLKALNIAEKNNFVTEKLNLYNNIGVLYKNQELYDKAIEYFEKALKYGANINSNKDLISLYLNIANANKNKENFDTAYTYYIKSLDIAIQIKDSAGLFKIHNNLGSLFYHKKQYNKALAEYNKAILIYRNINKNNMPLVTYSSLGSLYLSLSDSLTVNKNKYLKYAISYSEQAYKKAKEIDNFNIIKNTSNTLMLAYEKTRNKSKALMYAHEYIKSTEALYNVERLNAISKIEKKYKKEKEQLLIEKLQKEQDLRNERIKRLQIENTWTKRQRIVFPTIAIILILIIINVTLSLRKNKKNSKKINKLNTELKETSKQVKLQYLDSIKQNIEIKTKSHEVELQKQKVEEKHKQLQELTNNLTASEEELKQQNEILYQKNEEILQQRNKIEEVVRQFEDTINNMEDVYLKTNRNFIYTQVSPSIKKYLNINSFDEIIGKPLTEFWKISEQDLRNLIRNILRDNHLKDYLFNYKTTDGKINHAKINVRVLYDKNKKFNGVEGIIRDVTSDIESQNRIAELNKQKEVLINNLPSAIYYKNINLQYIEVNNQFAQLLGKMPDDIIGKTDKEVASKQIYVECEKLDKEVIKTKKPVLNYIKTHIDDTGNKYWVSTSKIPFVDSNNNVAGIIGVVTDITEQIVYEKELEKSKNKIELAHKNITDNINYAKTIQQALLPSYDIIKNNIKDFFVFFKPKEQVSGDFYFFKKIRKHIVFAAADCTGHGVSGGFLTMLGITYLNDMVSNKDVNHPATVLNLLRNKVKNTYKIFGSENRNGLDIALCALNTETNELEYSGAFNPLWIIREGELIEYKATRNPIGYYVDEVEFVNHTIQLYKGDNIYIFSDGFADQFGGEIDKKYTARMFKRFLISISHLSMNEQEYEIEREFNNWKGNEEQVDDVLVMGLKIS